jgi:hypothetical protein
MATTVYSVDEDLSKVRPNILTLGVSDWTTHHEEAFDMINRLLISKWYIQAATENGFDWRAEPFDPEKVDASQLVRASSYKTLELAYLYLMKDSPEPDGFEREMELFRKLFDAEMRTVLGVGISYDWDESGTIEDDETYQPQTRRLYRA